MNSYWADTLDYENMTLDRKALAAFRANPPAFLLVSAQRSTKRKNTL